MLLLKKNWQKKESYPEAIDRKEKKKKRILQK